MARKKIAIEPPPVKKKEYICTIHDEITSFLEDMRDLDFTECTISEIPEMQKKLFELIASSLEKVVDAKERGIAMENRLLQYRSAIDDLGYRRIGKE